MIDGTSAACCMITAQNSLAGHRWLDKPAKKPGRLTQQRHIRRNSGIFRLPSRPPPSGAEILNERTGHADARDRSSTRDRSGRRRLSRFMSASVLRLIPGIFRSAAPRMILGQYSTRTDPLRFISLAVEAPRPMIFANSDAPPKASIRAEIVRSFSMTHA